MKFFVTIAATLLAFASPVQASDAALCASSGKFARVVMEARQVGLSKEEVIAGFNQSSIYELAVSITEAAFLIPVYSSTGTKALAIKLFGDKIQQVCLDA